MGKGMLTGVGSGFDVTSPDCADADWLSFDYASSDCADCCDAWVLAFAVTLNARNPRKDAAMTERTAIVAMIHGRVTRWFGSDSFIGIPLSAAESVALFFFPGVGVVDDEVG